uniref:T-box domain-containing protein n=1 Tax=Denticeps clupeoides TaxID=299321 RepID=A0AAY4CYQ0_9TELE
MDFCAVCCFYLNSVVYPSFIYSLIFKIIRRFRRICPALLINLVHWTAAAGKDEAPPSPASQPRQPMGRGVPPPQPISGREWIYGSGVRSRDPGREKRELERRKKSADGSGVKDRDPGQMGGVGAGFNLDMLRGAEAHHLLKDGKEPPDPRFCYPDPVQPSLQFHPPDQPAPFGAQPGRFYPPPPPPPGSCHFGGAGDEPYPASPDPYPGFQHGYPRPALYPVAGLQVSGKTQVLLNNYPLWAKFHKFQTEMIITKQGRRMFPFLSFNISALDPTAHYSVYVDVVLADQHHWRYQGGKWVQCGKAEGNMPGNRTYMHPDSPNTGAHWMRQELSFSKLKLTNNKGSSNNVAQMIVLQSLHKYQPRLHIAEVKEDGSEVPFLAAKSQTFVFPETQFIAVTAYQNADITQLKIDHNPFAKGFRDNYDTLYAPPDPDRLTPSPPDGQQLLASGCYHPQPYLPEQYMGPLPQGRFSIPQQGPKEPAGSPHGRWYLPGAHAMPPTNRLDFGCYDGDYSPNGLFKPYPLQTPGNPALGYYQESPFSPAGVSGGAPGPWGAGRPSPPYLNHPHPSKPTPGLGWFRSMPSGPPAADKCKDAGLAGDDPWLEAPSVRSVDSADSGLYDGGTESKKRRVSPYASSTENSPANRGTEPCEKDGAGDAGYYGFYAH